jgi:hypothetical protein
MHDLSRRKAPNPLDVGMKHTLCLAACGLTLGLAALAAPAAAHHSFAMFDQTRTVTFRGTIKDFQWSNPHAVVWVVLEPQVGAAPTSWTIELTSPGNLTRMGWTRHALKTGDRVDVEINPLRDGQHGGSLRKITVLDTGQVLTSSLQQVQAKPAS